jgi:hypothetical protein
VQEGSFGKKIPTLIQPPSKCGRCVQHSLTLELWSNKNKLEVLKESDHVVLYIFIILHYRIKMLQDNIHMKSGLCCDLDCAINNDIYK